MTRVAVLLVAVLLQGCASIYAGELARDALAKCQVLSAVDFKGGRWHESASTSANCLPAPVPAPVPRESRYGHADR